MRGHCILSHGFESGPDATKVTALAEAAEKLGWSCERPDYTDLDAKRDVSELGDVPARLPAAARPRAGRGDARPAGAGRLEPGRRTSPRWCRWRCRSPAVLMAPPIRMVRAAARGRARADAIIHGGTTK